MRSDFTCTFEAKALDSAGYVPPLDGSTGAPLVPDVTYPSKASGVNMYNTCIYLNYPCGVSPLLNKRYNKETPDLNFKPVLWILFSGSNNFSPCTYFNHPLFHRPLSAYRHEYSVELYVRVEYVRGDYPECSFRVSHGLRRRP